MSTPTIKTDPGSSKPVTTPPVSRTKFLSLPWRIPPPSCFQTIVTVEVGAQKKAFLMHKDLLIFYSDYFRGAFNGSFSEATEGKISLADERVDVFSVVNQFVYTRQLSDKVDSHLEYEILIRAWIFGEKYLMPSLQNKAMTTIMKRHTETNVIPTFQMKLIYDNTLPGTPLRRFVTDLVAYRCDMGTWMTPEGSKQWPHEALADLLRIMGAKRMEEFGRFVLPEANKSRCFYHVHASRENCDTKL